LAIIILIFGETIPKAIFRRERNKLIVFLAPILKLTFNLFSPLLKILTHLTSSLKEIKDKEENYLTKERMKILIDEGEKGGVVGKNEGEIINGVFELSEVKVKEVMTPRVNMVCVEAETKLKEVIKIFKEHKYSRIPVYDGNIDEIIGIIYIKDLLNFWNFEKEDLRAIEFIRLPFFIPESKPIGDLLKEFRQKMIHVAIVVDEYGGTTGIVTLEDLLEEIFGEIEDEYDKEEIQIKSIGKNVYLIDGDTEIEKIKEILKIEFPKGDFETISGYILEVLKHIPSPGEVIKLNDNIITIIDSDEQSINRIKIEKF
jgi:CBS domain containing-hemolysin-like protein